MIQTIMARSILARKSRSKSILRRQVCLESRPSQPFFRLQSNGGDSSGSIISTVPHNLHKMRRSPMNPLFSKRSVVEYSGSVVSTVDKLCARLEEFHTSQNPVDLRVAFSALTADVISQYCYGKSYDCLEKSDFDPDLYSNTASGGELGLLLKQCPWIFTIANSMPYWLIAWLNPKVVQMLDRRTVNIQSLHLCFLTIRPDSVCSLSNTSRFNFTTHFTDTIKLTTLFVQNRTSKFKYKESLTAKRKISKAHLPLGASSTNYSTATFPPKKSPWPDS